MNILAASLRWLFGWKDKDECESRSNLENLGGSSLSKNSANINHNSCYGPYGSREARSSIPPSQNKEKEAVLYPSSSSNTKDVRIDSKIKLQTLGKPIYNSAATRVITPHGVLNHTSSSNVSSFTQSSSIHHTKNKDKETILLGTHSFTKTNDKETILLGTNSFTKTKDIPIDSKIKPPTSEKSTENSYKPLVFPLVSNQTRTEIYENCRKLVPASASASATHTNAVNHTSSSKSPLSTKSNSTLSSTSYGTLAASPESLPLLNKPFLSVASDSFTTTKAQTNYNWVEKNSTPLYVVPEDYKDLLEKDIVPEVLRKPLSPSTYKDYFAALQYAEDLYFEKWDGFEMGNMSMTLIIEHEALQFHKAKICGGKGKYKNASIGDQKDEKMLVQIELEGKREKRPFLLSRDYAYTRPSGTHIKAFKGIIYRVVKSTCVLVEFMEDFFKQHKPDSRYDVKFSFNRVCLKRAHQAIQAASDVVFRNFLFPDCMSKSSSAELLRVNPDLGKEQLAINQIVNHRIPIPYLLEGHLVNHRIHLPYPLEGHRSSRYGEAMTNVVEGAVLQLYQMSSSNRILICAPTNHTCDLLMRGNLKKEILEFDIFRFNAAFRELKEVPQEILSFCHYDEGEELFYCPPLPKLEKYRVILSTFMSSFRLHNAGIKAGHFTHIFLVDASSTIEPETLVPLVHLANEKTSVVVTGAPGDRSRWVRSKIGRQNGLQRSYFERLRAREVYMNFDPKFISQLDM